MAENNNHFNLTLDTTKPTGTVSVPSYVKAANLTVTIAPNTDTAYMKVWVVCPNGTSTIPATPVYEAKGTTKTITLTDEGVYTVHAVLLDTVGNEQDISSSGSTNKKVNFDKTAPTVSTVTIADPTPATGQPAGETNSLTNNYTITYTDGPTGSASGVIKLTISCPDFANTVVQTVSGTSWSGTIAFKEGTVEGTKTVTVVATDAAGNDSAAKTGSIYYDPDANNVTLYLYKESARTNLVPASPSYTNVTKPYPSIAINTSAGQADIVGYKLWGDYTGGASTEPSTWIDVTKGTNPININQITLNSGNGVKNVYMKAIDDEGNVSPVRTYTVNLDTVNPVVTIGNPSASAISNVSGHTSSTIAISATDSESSASGIASWQFYCNSTIVDSSTSAISSKTETITSSTSGMVEGSNTFKVTATDKAGNTVTTSTVTIVLDTTVPTAVIASPTNQWYNAHPTVTLNQVSENCTAWVWIDNSSTTSDVVPSGAVGTSIAQGDGRSIADANISWTGLNQSNINYVHVKLQDNVGNVKLLGTQVFKYDSVVPSKPEISWTQSAYGSTAASLNIVYANKDATSGVAQMYIESVQVDSKESITPSTTGWVNVTSPKALTLTTGDGLKKVRAKLKDNAGNESDWSEIAITELDTTKPTGSLVLRNPGTTTPKASPSNIAAVDLYATFVDDQITTQGSGYYAVWGDFNGSPSTDSGYTPKDSDWQQFSTGGSTSITLAKTATSGDGTKHFYIKFKDNVGLVSDRYDAQFVLDATAPEVFITEDYTIVSKVHTERRSSATTIISGKYCDEVKVIGYIGTSTVKEKYIAYKAVAYNDTTEASTYFNPDGTWETNHTIEGTTWTGTATSSDFTITIYGDKYEKALNGGVIPSAGGKDGVHIVVVYVKDEAGTWSGKAIFA